MLRFKQFILLENTDATFDWPEGDDFEKRKKVVRPSAPSPDPAIKFGELSPDYAAFQDMYRMSDQEIIDTFEKFPPVEDTEAAKRLKARLSGIDKEYPIGSKENLFRKALEIKGSIISDRTKLESPNIFIDDATKLKPKIPDISTPEKWFWWNNLSPEQQKLYTRPDLRGVLNPAPTPFGTVSKQVTVPAATKSSMVKTMGKVGLKSLPVLGTLASVAAIADRAQAGDYTGAALEAGSEIADFIPGIGTAASLGIQGYLAARDAGETDEKAPTDKKVQREVDAAIKAGSPSKVRVTGPKL